MEEKLKGLEIHLSRIFIAGAVFGALSCFSRPDYNLPLYAFLYLMWDQDIVSYPLPLNSSFLNIALLVKNRMRKQDSWFCS